MKIKVLIAVLCLALCLTACADMDVSTAAKKNTVTICGTAYPLDTTELSLRGASQPEPEQILLLQNLTSLDLRDTGISAQDYDTLHQALPECNILWSVPFQGGYLDSTTQSVTVSTLSPEDVEALSYLSALTYVDGTGCTDVEALYTLAQLHPNCQVDYTLTVQGVTCALDSLELTLPTVNSEDMVLIHQHIPALETLTLTQLQNEPEALLTLMEEYTDITFVWDTEILGVTVNSQADFLDFSDIIVDDPEALESLITRLPNLTQVDMCRCGISNEDMDAMNRRYENIKFVWEVKLENVGYRTDITYLMPQQEGLWLTDANSYLLKYFTELECLDLGHHPVGDCDYVAYMPNMKYLLLADTNISSIEPLRGLENLVYLEIFLTNVTDYEPLLTLKNLEVLNLCYTAGDPEVIAQLTWVEYIRWIGYANLEQKATLPARMPDTLIELGVNKSSTGGMWRETQQYFDMRDLLGMFYMKG